MMKTPLVSVIMPVYNEKPEYLTNSVSSILSQSYNNFEFIIIDDGSEKYVGDIISQFSDSRILYQKLDKNLKICNALNNGLVLASGQYVAIMHSDDVSINSRLEKEVEILESKKSVGLVNSYSVVKRNNDYSINILPLPSNELKFLTKYIKNKIVHSNVMYRKNILEENALWYDNDYVFAEDYKMWCDMADFCDFYTIPEILTIYNLNVNPSRQNYDVQVFNAKKVLLQNYIKSLDSIPADIYNKFIRDKKIAYSDYLQLSNETKKLPEMIKNQVSNEFYYSFMHNLNSIARIFDPYRRINYVF